MVTSVKKNKTHYGFYNLQDSYKIRFVAHKNGFDIPAKNVTNKLSMNAADLHLQIYYTAV